MELGKTIKELEIGEKAEFTKTITEADVTIFAGLTGDFNPMHMNEEFAKRTPFGTRIAHGALPIGLIAPVLGMKLPGLGTIVRKMTTRFKLPVRFGDTITAIAEVGEKNLEKNTVLMKLSWVNQEGAEIADGEVVVMPPLEEFRKIFEEKK